MLNWGPDQKTDEEGISSGIESLWQSARQARWFYEQTWYRNLAFLMGRQYVNYVDAASRLIEPPAPAYRVRLVSNLIVPVHRGLKAKILSEQPVYHVLPGNNTNQAFGDARISESALNAVMQKLEFPVFQDDNVGMFLAFGSSFGKVWFDPNQGRKQEFVRWTTQPNKHPYIEQTSGLQYHHDTTGEPLFLLVDAANQPVTSSYKIGEIAMEAVSPFEIYEDHTAKSWEKSTHVMHHYTMNVYKARDVFNDPSIQPEIGIQDNSIERQLLSLVGRSRIGDLQDQTIVTEYWEIPSNKWPKGRVIFKVGKKIIGMEDIPEEYLDQLVPFAFTKYDFVRMPKIFWGKSLIEDLIPLQQEYNRTRSQFVEYKNMMMKGKVLMPIQAQVSDNAYTDETGEKIYYVAGNWPAPHVQAMPSPPASVFMHLDIIRNDMMEVSGLREQSRGRAGKLRSGTAIAQMLEQDDNMLSTTKRYMSFQYEKQGNMVLSIMKHRYTEPRMLRYVGSDEVQYLQDFLGSAMNPNQTIHCEMGTGLSANKQIREATILGRFQAQLISKKQAQQALEINHDEMFTKTRLDERIATQENEDMIKGILHEVMPWQNHVVHSQHHSEFMNQTFFRNLRPEIQHAFTLHTVSHDEAMQNPQGMNTAVKLEVQAMVGPNLAAGAAEAQALQQAQARSGLGQGGPQPPAAPG